MFIRTTAFLVLGWLLLTGVRPGHAQETQPSEYQVKAAFLYNFAIFVEWPSETLPKKDSPFVIGVLGESPIANDLKNVISNKTVNGHAIEIKKIDSPSEATNCHILFISASVKKPLPEIISDLHQASVLTVGEADSFIKDGGMIKFVVEKKMRLQINDETAKKARLKISSKLLNVASRPPG